jgi:hypothetical protein
MNISFLQPRYNMLQKPTFGQERDYIRGQAFEIQQAELFLSIYKEALKKELQNSEQDSNAIATLRQAIAELEAKIRRHKIALAGPENSAKN